MREQDDMDLKARVAQLRGRLFQAAINDGFSPEAAREHAIKVIAEFLLDVAEDEDAAPDQPR